jgi:hypothetical protein
MARGSGPAGWGVESGEEHLGRQCLVPPCNRDGIAFKYVDVQILWGVVAEMQHVGVPHWWV